MLTSPLFTLVPMLVDAWRSVHKENDHEIEQELRKTITLVYAFDYLSLSEAAFSARRHLEQTGRSVDGHCSRFRNDQLRAARRWYLKTGLYHDLDLDDASIELLFRRAAQAASEDLLNQQTLLQHLQSKPGISDSNRLTVQAVMLYAHEWRRYLEKQSEWLHGERVWHQPLPKPSVKLERIVNCVEQHWNNSVTPAIENYCANYMTPTTKE